jgi:hypothetical protein
MRFALLNILLLYFAASASAHHYPVEVFLDKIKNLDDAKRFYQVQFEDNLSLKVKQGSSFKDVKSCTDFEENLKKGWKLELDGNQIEINEFIALDSRCRTLKTLIRLKDSKQSFVKDVPFDKSFIQFLPSNIFTGFAVNNDYNKIYERAEETRTSYLSLNRALEYETPLFVKTETPNSLHYPGAFYIDLQARGDANGDGIEDLLIRLVEDRGGSMRNTQLMTLSRVVKNGIFFPVERLNHPKKGCNGDEIDQIRSKFNRDFKPPFKKEALDYLEQQINQCKEFSPQLHLIWLMNDAAFVGYKLEKPEACKKFLGLSHKVIKEIGWVLVPKKLQKALLHNKKVCQYEGKFE